MHAHMSSSPVATHPPGAAAPVSAAADDARAVTIDLAPPSADDIALFAVTRAAVDRCAIAAWLPAFRAHTIRTRLIALPAEFVAYLDGATDGVMRLPRCATEIVVSLFCDCIPLSAETHVSIQIISVLSFNLLRFARGHYIIITLPAWPRAPSHSGVAPTTTGAAPSRFRDDDSECSEGDGDSDNNDDDDDDSHHFQNGGELTAADREWLRECQLKAEQVRRLDLFELSPKNRWFELQPSD